MKTSPIENLIVQFISRTHETYEEKRKVIAPAESEHSALVAVAEAAKKVERSLMEHYQAGIAMRPQAVTTLYGDLNHALANLAALRAGK